MNAPHKAATKKRSARSFRMWAGIHRWTSLVSTLFLLMLCITGLLLIFQIEIDETFGTPTTLVEVAADNTAPTLDSIVAATLARHPGNVMISLDFAKRWPIVVAQSAASLDTSSRQSQRNTIDLRTGLLTEMPRRRSAVMQFLHTLHADLFLGLPGGLFIGVMALIMIASVVSGLVLYPPFVRRFGFGTVRVDKSRRVLWLDLHNVTGVVTMAWLLIVAVSGAINTLHGPISTSVQENLYKAMRTHVATAQSKSASASSRPWSVDAAIAAARDVLPETQVMSVFFPGAEISPDQHYVVLTKGTRTMTPELFYAALIDARTGTVAAAFETEGIAKAMLLTQPLHFPTSFGGLPIKIVWALFDLVTIVVLGSGLYLWVGKRRR